MMSFLPKEISEGLERARKLAERKNTKLKIHVDGKSYKVMSAWENGFALEPSILIRGRVALYDGERLISHCLIVASEEGDGERRFEYKRITEAVEEQPLDFYRAPDAPVALITQH
ncbi:hypothetical protein ROA7450_00865 [Roseovarius albus]|uniref:Uncharacterized protein n=2 Tax=Roseovarius albus TaxID=1247867 RepID=A0A1X6YJJ0_9RHOB|nr:hypothetical protein ROA7450_00865 [Roseovarius albus]